MKLQKYIGIKYNTYKYEPEKTESGFLQATNGD